MKWIKTGVFCLLAMLLMTVTAGAETAALPTDEITLTRYTQSVDTTTKTVGLTLQVENPREEKMECRFYTLIENPDGTADSCQSHSVTLQPGVQLIPLSHTYETAGEGKKLAVFCWDRSMHPLSDPLRRDLSLEQTVTGLTLNHQQSTLILATGQTDTLTYTYTPDHLPDPGVSFLADDSGVVTVDQKGVVTPKKAGVATVTAITKDGTAYATCRVTVISDVTRITLNQTQVTLGSSTTQFQLTATVTPADAPVKTLTFTSSDPKVASVDAKGLIKALAPGKAVITAATTDGQATASCTVTVTEMATAIKLNKTSIKLWDYSMYTLVPTVTGVKDPRVVWTSSDDTIATVSDSGIVYGVFKGTATITATVGNVKATCKVQVYREYDYTGTIAAHFESGDDPGRISGSGTDKSYGCFQFYAGTSGPKSFYNWLISTGFNPTIGNTLKAAHQKDGGKNNTYGSHFDAAWKNLAATQREEFRSCQMGYGMSIYYEPIVNRLVSELGFYPDNYSIALKAAIWSRSIQHGTGGAFNRIRDAFASIGGFKGKTEKELITAIYKECGATVSKPPAAGAIPMNKDSEIAVQYGLVGKYMKYYYGSSSSMQAGVWKRLNITELNMLYDMLENPPIVITK